MNGAPPMDAATSALLRGVGRSPRLRACLRHVEALLGPTQGQLGLDLGGEGGVLSWCLRRRGGTWCSMDVHGPGLESLQRLVGEGVYPLEGVALPFPDQTFDCVVVLDVLERLQDAAAFIQECHRVLKPAGRLVVNVPFLRHGSLLPLVRRLLGGNGARTGYTEAQLFSALKDGFDVQETRLYSRLFTEAGDQVVRRFALRRGRRDVWLEYARLCRLTVPLAWLGAQLDHLLFLCRGYRLIVRAKRRLWIPRKTPVLRDGRSLAEATLSTRIGTASPMAALTAPREKSQVRSRR